MVTGEVTSAGAVARGSGFRVSRTATGSYTVTFSSAFTAYPCVIVAVLDTTAGFPVFVGAGFNNTGTGFRVHTYNTAGTLTDLGFFFLATPFV